MQATAARAKRPSTGAVPVIVLPGRRAGAFVNFCHALLSRGRIVPSAAPVLREDFTRTSGQARPLLDACRDLIGKATPRFVIGEGGCRAERVVIGGRRRRLRLWDAEVLGALGPWRYSAACLDLLVAVHNDIVALRREASKASSQASADRHGARANRKRRAASRERIASAASPRAPGPMPAPETWADVLFFHLALTRLLNSGIGSLVPPRPGDPAGARADSIARLTSTWIEASPLTSLCDPHRSGAGEPRSTCRWKDLKPLLDAGEGVLLTFLARSIASRWVAAEAAKLEMNVLRFRETLAAQRAQVEPLLDALALAMNGREHLLRCFAEFFRLLMARHGPADPLVRRTGALAERMDSMSETEALLDEAAEPYAWGERLNGLADEVRDRAFVERTESQRLFLQDVQEIYEPVHDQIALIHRRLSRTIG